MVYAAFTLGDSQAIAVAQSLVWVMLAVTTAISVVGMVMMGFAMNSSHRHTFYKHLSLCSLLDQLWETRTLAFTQDGSYMSAIFQWSCETAL